MDEKNRGLQWSHIEPYCLVRTLLRLLADVLSLSWTAVHLHNVVQQLLQLVGVVPLGKGVDLQPFPKLLPHLCFHLVKICGFACRP